MKVLVINSGSSSLKFTLFSMAAGEEKMIASGQVERVGSDKPNLIYKRPDGFKLEVSPKVTNHADALKAVCSDLRYMAMGGKVYDRQENTFTLTKLKLKFEIVRYLDWESLPEAARNFILLSASRLFMENAVGSSDMVNMIAEQLAVADRELKELDLALEGPELFSDFDKMVIARGISPQNRGLPWR